MLSFRRLLPSSRALTRLPAGAPQRTGFRWKSTTTTTTTGSQGLGAVLRPTAIDFAVHIHMTDSGDVSTKAMQKTLKQALRENEELPTDNQKLRETAQRMNARMAALMEENEELRKERDSLQQQLEEVKENHETELRKVTKEMAAAARFSDSEWREHCDRVEAQCVRLQKTVDACVPAALAHLTHEEPVVRQKLQDEEEEQRCDLQGRKWRASLEEVAARDAVWVEAVFAARGLPMSELRRAHLGKGPGGDNHSYAVGKGLYNLFLALRPGGPVDRFAMRELLKGETNVSAILYNTQGRKDTWSGEHFTIPAADAYELAACVLCHLPALEELLFIHLPPLSTRGLEWVSQLPQSMEGLQFRHTAYTVADLREMHRRRGSRTFLVDVHTNYCTDWGEFEGVGDVSTKKARVNEELGGMVRWW